ncbi:MAG: DUF4167 domain-containing protein [SAR116 cluster bacterium]|jgi:hypothetical protein|nr:MAG: DUF4167 domain-containing protein [SAR116 cluster bacterium]
MRQPQNAKRGRGRGRRGNGNAQPNVPNRNTSYESNGPDVKLRGNAQQLHEKYVALAHDAAAAGERITAEAYTQFADHYYRLHQAAIDAAEERKAQHADRQPRSGAPQPVIDEQPAVEEKPADDGAENGAESGDANGDAKAAGGAEVVDLTPAQLAEKVQEDQDPASA